MEEDDELVDPRISREIIVKDIRIEEVSIGNHNKWLVAVTFSEISRPEYIEQWWFSTKSEAEEYAERLYVGMKAYFRCPHGSSARSIIESYIDNSRPNYFMRRRDTWVLTRNTLIELGLIDGFSISPEVLDALGEDRVRRIKEVHSKNWEKVAVFEYCYFNVPHNSIEYIAASCEYHRDVLNDQFAAGYLQRDLELIVSGLENISEKVSKTRKLAGEKGSKASAESRKQRMLSLVAGMEAVFHRNPDIGSLGYQTLAQLGVREAATANAKLWSQGAGRLNEYLIEIRSGQAGKDLQARFFKMLGQESA